MNNGSGVKRIRLQKPESAQSMTTRQNVRARYPTWGRRDRTGTATAVDVRAASLTPLWGARGVGGGEGGYCLRGDAPLRPMPFG